MSQLLIIDDDLAICRMLELHFLAEGHQVQVAHSVDQGLARVCESQPELIILDIRMSGKSGLEGLLELKPLAPHAGVIMITAFHDMESTIQAMQGGADDYIHKPIDLVQLDQAVQSVLQRRLPNNEEMDLDTFVANANSMVGSSSAMREVFKTIGRVASNTATVLITGESGTGKELVARAIHNSSTQRSGPFVAINCAALVETLLESEMFGHERGAFSGAINQQKGKFALAENGTLFLDEVGELSPTIQAKLLRVLQEKEFSPIGSKQVQPSNARIITATNVDLKTAVAAKLFREDLYYRLEVVQLQLPPLRERLEDIAELVPTLLNRINRDLGAKVTRVSNDVLEALRGHHWPGNVRELENVLTKAVALCPSDCLTSDLLPTALQGLSADTGVAQSLLDKSLAQCSLKEMEQAHVRFVLQETGGHKGRACEILGISRPRLQRMIADFK
tara:strand:- start:177 stop:1523 length:1347 start_codon:yes stop_codon:yes gene_type:complete